MRTDSLNLNSFEARPEEAKMPALHCQTVKLTKKRTRFKTSYLQDNNKLISTTTTTNCLIIIQFLIALAAWAVDGQQQRQLLDSNNNNEPQQPAYYPSVTLAKFGLIRGLKFAALDNQEMKTNELEGQLSTITKNQQHDNQAQSNSVAAFLGVPYAAPPTGPLRFMPPGAARPRGGGGGSLPVPVRMQECKLAIGDSRPVTPTRAYVKLGAECVRLADWLVASLNESASKRVRQSEDCLNVNLFVPYESTLATARYARTPSEYPHDDPFDAASGQSADERRHRRSTRKSTNESISDGASVELRQELRATQSDNEPECYLEPISSTLKSAQSRGTHRRKLPVLVLFNKSANLTQLMRQAIEMARRTQSIVITFNYRIGLLGYLPYNDDDHQSDSNLPSTQTSPSLANQIASTSGRQNHAIWDQLGLLHWLRHNVASFNGDSSNITLAATDNKSARQLQLLALSPIAKGLFQRLAVMSSDSDNRKSTPAYLDHLMRLALRSRELKSKLISELGLIVRQSLMDGHNGTNDDRNVFEFLRSANLSQLARVESQLGSISVDSQLRLIDLLTEPNLDDKLLFPYFAHLIKLRHRNALANAGGSDPHHLFWSSLAHAPLPVNSSSSQLAQPEVSLAALELNYCLYIGRLYEGLYDAANQTNRTHRSLIEQLDPLKLLPPSAHHQSGSSTASPPSIWSWFQVPGDTKTPPTPQTIARGANWSQSRRANAIEFYHLRHAHLLNQLLRERGRKSLSSNRSSSSPVHPFDDSSEDEELPVPVGQHVTRSRRDTPMDQLLNLHDQLIEQMNSYDLLLGLHTGSDQSVKPEVESNSTMIDSLMSQSAAHERTISWIRLADLHYLSGALAELRHRAGNGNNLQDPDNSCDFISDKIGLIKQRQDSGEPDGGQIKRFSKLNTRTTYVFSMSGKAPPEQLIDWLNQDQLIETLAQFVWFGEPISASNWRPYDTLTRHIEPLDESLGKSGQLSAAQVATYLDLIPYLANHLNSSSAKVHSGLAISPPSDLLACLSELELQLQVDHTTPAPELCLGREVNKLRNQLRWGAAKELEPLVRHFRLGSGKQSRVSSVTTRNLVNQSEEFISGASQAPEEQVQELIIGVTSSSANETLKQMRWAGNETTTTTTTTSQLATTGNNRKLQDTSSIRGFFAKTYKDAVGQALAIVIGTGALIFLLNLLIVLVIAIRSARARRNQDERPEVTKQRRRHPGVQDMDESCEGPEVAGAHQLASGGQYLLPGGQQRTGDFGPPTKSALAKPKANGFGVGVAVSASFKSQQHQNQRLGGSSRSIKFHLPGGVGGQEPEGVGVPGEYQSEFGAHMSPPTSDSQHSNSCAIHGNTDAQAQQVEQRYESNGMLINSPPSYAMFQELSDDQLEVELQQLGGDCRATGSGDMTKMFQLSSTAPVIENDLTCAGPIYLTHQHQLVDLMVGGVYTGSCNHHQFNQSLGSSSLTSPFASQSTPTNTTASSSGAIYTIRPNAPASAAHAAHATNQLVQQSPSSSGTLSTSVATPIPQVGGTLTRCKHHHANNNYLAAPFYHQQQDEQQEMSSSSPVQLLIMAPPPPTHLNHR